MKEVKIKFTTDTTQVDKSLKKTTKGVDGLKKSADKSVKSSKGMASGLTSSFGALKTSILAAVPALRTFSAALAATGVGGIVLVMGALIGLFAKATTEGAEFAKTLSTLRAITGNTKEELVVLSDQAKELGRSTQFTASQVVKLQVELAKLGFTVSDISNSTPAILNLAASLEVDLAEAAEFAGSVVRSFGLTTKETARVVDVMSLSTSSSALNFDALKESLKLAAPIARATNTSLEKTTAILGVLANNGLKGSIAGTGLSKIFIELNKKGITLEEALSQVNSSSNKLTTSMKLVGTIGAKSLNTLANSAGDIDILTKALEDAEGAAKRMAEVRLDNLSGDTTKLSSAWSGLLLRIEDGEGILNRMARGAIQNITLGMGELIKAVSLVGIAFESVFNAVPAHFEGTKNVISGGLDILLSSITIFSNKAKIAISTVPIIGKAIDIEEASQNILDAEALLKDGQDRLLKGLQEQTDASNSITYGGVIATYAAEQAKLKIVKETQEEIKEILLQDPLTDPEEEAETITPTAKKKDTKVLTEEEKQAKIQEIKDYYFLKGLEREISEIERKTEAQVAELIALGAHKELIEQIEQESADRIEAITKKYSDVVVATAEDTEEKKVDIAAVGIQGINTLTNAASQLTNALADKDSEESEERSRQAFEVDKAMKLASGATSVTTGIMNAFSQTTDLTPTQTLRMINGGVAAAVGLANLATIASSTYDGGGTPPPAQTAAAPPSFNLVEGTEGNQIQESINLQNDSPVKAYVVSGDVTSQQSLDRQIESGSGI
jgi:cytochrome c biogenesis protein CcdA